MKNKKLIFDIVTGVLFVATLVFCILYFADGRKNLYLTLTVVFALLISLSQIVMHIIGIYRNENESPEQDETGKGSQAERAKSSDKGKDVSGDTESSEAESSENADMISNENADAESSSEISKESSDVENADALSDEANSDSGPEVGSDNNEN